MSMATKVTKTTKGSKTKTSTKKLTNKKLDTKNVKSTVKQIVKSKREIKYKYPTEVELPMDRKQWRQKVRGKLRKFERDITAMRKNKSKGITKVNVAYKKYRKLVLLVP